MSELDDLHDSLHGARIVLKGTVRTLRSTLQYLTDLERRLEELDAEPLEAERDEHTEPDRGAGDWDDTHRSLTAYPGIRFG